jgi:hypothetical protein
MVRDGDVACAGNYLALRAVLRAVGRRIQVYVDSDDVDQVAQEVLDDLVSTFDERIYPTSARTVGQATDIDSDGRFTILVSSWLSRLGNGKNAVDGFVRVTDLDPAFPAPFSNHCDMMYLSAGLKSGSYLRTVLAHEYMHAVVFSRKSRQALGAGQIPLEEEGWLDEALAHLAEDLQGFSRSNLDYRISAFLSQPERYQLVVDDYYTADLFRSHGNRGSTYLFLRWCLDQYGPELLTSLIDTRLRGVTNLEAATGCTFEDLYRRWSVALFFSGLEANHPTRGHDQYRSISLRRPVGGWELAGPRTHPLSADAGPEKWMAAGTTSHYVTVRAAESGVLDVSVEGPVEADLQVTFVPLPLDLPSFELGIAEPGQPGVKGPLVFVRRSRGTPLTNATLAWEPLVPGSAPHSSGSHQGRIPITSGNWDHQASTHAPGASKPSCLVRLPDIPLEGGPMILKLAGTDATGRRVSGWAELPPPSSGESPAPHGRLVECVP